MGEFEVDSDGKPYCQCDGNGGLMLKIKPGCNTDGGITVTFNKVAKSYRMKDVTTERYWPRVTARLEDIPADLIYLDATLASHCALTQGRILGGYQCRLPGTCR